MITDIDEAEFSPCETPGAEPGVASSKWVVLRFAGGDLVPFESWRVLAAVARNRLREGLRPLIVHSAAGVSQDTESILRAAVLGDATKQIASLRDSYRKLAAGLEFDRGRDADRRLADYFAEIEALAAEVRRLREVSPRIHTRMLVLGELMSTRLGAAFLNSNGIEADWVDALELQNIADLSSPLTVGQHGLSGNVDLSPDPALSERLATCKGVVLTQARVAGHPDGGPPLPGPAGSDTTAAYLAARLPARRLEIWAGVAGIYTADPQLVPSARLLKELNFDEALELSASGSQAVSPSCLALSRRSGIPVFVRCTSAPQIAGTVISTVTNDNEPQIKGVSTRKDVTLISISGFETGTGLAFPGDVLACFARHGAPAELVSASQGNVTVLIDTKHPTLLARTQQSLVADLGQIGRVRVTSGCAVISLAGKEISAVLPRLAAVFRVFDEDRAHLITQTADELKFSFVVDQKKLPKLVASVHDSVIPGAGGSRVFGSRWTTRSGDVPLLVANQDVWWIRKREQLLRLLDDKRSHVYVYDLDTVRAAAASLLELKSVDRVLYAMKANFNPAILRLISELGVDFECVSPGEVKHLQEVIPGIDTDRILFTPNFAPREEYVWGREQGLQLTLDNLYPLRAWPEVFQGQKLFIRVDPGQGRGHHEHVKTGGAQSKFGVPLFEIDELQELLERAGADVIGIHAHSGSGILDPDNWRSVAATLAKVADRFPNVGVLDLGGGLGVPDHSSGSEFDMGALDKTLAEIRKAHPKYRLWLEPGRYLVARSGVLLAKVTQVKGKGDMQYLGISTGMNSLIRPALYGAWHEIVNLSRAGEIATESVTVVGPVCETGDKLGTDRLLPPSRENDVIAIANAGAYGRVMSSRYNLREPAEEVVI